MKSFSNFFESFSKKIHLGYIVILFCLYVIFSVVVGGLGFIHNEMYLRMPVEISGKPLLQILFDIKTMNAGGWEARQLSYLFDVIDGNFVALCVRLGLPHFRSFTQYLFTFVLMIVFWQSMTEDMKLNRLLSIIFIALLLTTPSFIYSYYYRTSKIGVTLSSITLLFGLYRYYRNSDYSHGKPSKWYHLFIFFFLFSLGLAFFDVLGVLIAGTLSIYSFLLFVINPDKKKAAIFGGFCIAIVTWVGYFLWLGPILMLQITGQQADISYLASAPIQYIPAYLVQTAPIIFIDMVRYLVGYITPVQALVVLILITTLVIWVDLYKRNHRANFIDPSGKLVDNSIGAVVVHSYSFNFLFLVGGISFVYAFLVIRHVQILWPDIRPVYYIMPAQSILLFGLSAWIANIQQNEEVRKRNLIPALITIFAFLLAGNIIGSIKVKNLLYGGNNEKLSMDQNSLIVLDALKYIHIPGYLPPPNIASDPIYQLFTK
jgi:hypothetical protein